MKYIYIILLFIITSCNDNNNQPIVIKDSINIEDKNYIPIGKDSVKNSFPERIYNIETEEVTINNINQQDSNLKSAIFMLIILAAFIIALLIIIIIMLYYKEFFKLKLHI